MRSSSRKTTLRVVACAVVIAFCFSGCNPFGKSKATPSPSPSTSNSIRLKASITIEGAVNGQESYETPYITAGLTGGCRGLAKRKSSAKLQVGFVVPMPTNIGGHQTRWTVVVNPYRGPGVYATQFVIPMSAVFDAAKKGPEFLKTAQTTATATISQDASGTLTFSNIVAKNGRVESGSVRWTCTD